MSFLKIIAQKKFQLFIIILLTFCAYSNIFGNEFVAEDDEFIQNWKGKQQVSNIGKILAGAGPETREELVYRPVRGVFYVLYWQLFGDNKFGYHLNGIVVHLISTVLVFLITEKLVGGGKWVVGSRKEKSTNYKLQASESERATNYLPFVTALIFGLHPVHTEAITFMAASMDMGLGPMFLFLALYFFLRADEVVRFTKFRLLSILFAYLSYFTSDVALIFPAILVLVDVYLRRHFNLKDAVFRYGFYVFGVVAFLFLKIIFLHFTLSQNVFVEGGKFNYALLYMPVVILTYLGLLIFPVNLSISHLIAPKVDSFTYQFLPYIKLTVNSFFDLRFAIAVLIIFAVFLIAVFLAKRVRIISFGIFWFFVTFLPVSNLLVQPTILSERYIYVASFGFCLVVAWLLVRCLGSRGILLGITIITIITLVGAYGVLTFRRNSNWKNEHTLWSFVYKIYPESPLANLNLSYFYANEGDFAQSLSYAEKTVELIPTYYRAHLNLALVLDNLGRYDEAISEYKTAIDLNPLKLDAYLFMANKYIEVGKTDEAFKTFSQAAQKEEDFLKFGGDAYDIVMGVPEVRRITQRKVVLSNIYAGLGQLQKEKDEFDKAVESYNKSLLYFVDNSNARKGLGDVAFELGNNLVFQTDTHNIYFSKLGFSFVIPKGFRVFDLKEGLQITTEGVGYTIEIIPDMRERGQTIEDFVASYSKSYGVLVQHGYIDLKGPDSTYARMWNDNGISKSEFTVFFGNSVYDILVYPVSKDIQGVVELLVASLQD